MDYLIDFLCAILLAVIILWASVQPYNPKAVSAIQAELYRGHVDDTNKEEYHNE